MAHTFKDLSDINAGVSKHDTKSNCHDTDQDAKQSFQVPHSKAVYQEQYEGIYSCDDDTCNRPTVLMAPGPLHTAGLEAASQSAGLQCQPGTQELAPAKRTCTQPSAQAADSIKMHMAICKQES